MHPWKRQQLQGRKKKPLARRTIKLPPTTRTRTRLRFGRLRQTRDPKVPPLLWHHLHLGGDTSEPQHSWIFLSWDRAPIERLRFPVLSSCLRRGALRLFDTGGGSALVIPKACFRRPSPPLKIGPFPRGRLFGSMHVPGGPGAMLVLCAVLADPKGEVSEDTSPSAWLPGERSEDQ
eukprot:4431811-Amphidinium_carterae.1